MFRGVAPFLLLKNAIAIDLGARDKGWLDGLRKKYVERIQKSAERVSDAVGPDGKIHPMAAFNTIS